jgi:hypothetical protein
MIKSTLSTVDVKDLWSTYKFSKNCFIFLKIMCINCALVCIGKKQKIKELDMAGVMTLGVDLKSLPLAECQFESGRGHHL